MKKRAKLPTLVLTVSIVSIVSMVITGCGSGNAGNSNSGDEIKDLVTWETSNREMENMFILNSEMANDLNVLANCVEGLLETDVQGKLIPGLAKEWGTEDGGLTWTFHLRDGVKWVDVNGNEKADCTAQDFVTGLEWVMNFHKNGAMNTSMPTALIKGAGEYYEYTKNLPAEEALSMNNTRFLEMVGIETPDDDTVVYHCISNATYFDSVCPSACLYPLSADFVAEVGVENVLGSSNETIWYNGPYTLTEFIQGNTKTLTKNPTYWDTECTLFDTVTIRMIEDTTVGFQLYQNGEVDHIDLSEANLRTIWENENHEYRNQLVEKRPGKYSYQMHFNYDKNNEDGSKDENWNKAIVNEAFRQSLYYGLDLTKYFERTNFINPLKCENNAYTMQGLLYFSDGTEYTAKVKELLGMGASNGETPIRYDSEKAQELKAKAMEELAAMGVIFPVEFDYYIVAGSQNALDTATVLQQVFSECLGNDYVKLNVGTYVSSQTKEVIQPQKHSFVINGWGADYADPQNFLGQETYGEDTAYYAMNYSNINNATDEDLIATYQEFTELVNKANAITDDMDARYLAYAEAEAYMLEHALSVPTLLEISWQLTHVNDYTKSHAMYGIQNYMYKNWETAADAYTTAEYTAFEEEFNR